MTFQMNRLPMSIAFRLVAPGTAVLLLLALAGCGSEGEAAASEASGTPTVSATTSSPANDGSDELKQAVQAYSDAFLTGDVAAYDMLSERCQDRTDRNEFIGMLMAAKSTYESAIPLASFDAEVSGNLARVTYTYSIAAINQDAEPWVREGGDWKQDDC